jgi:catechol 2,3-dioxygenase-like lactoylglutathione lyase family enzyme
MGSESKLGPNVEQAVPSFLVSNIEKSIGYYVAGLGFEMTNKWINDGKLEWCWLQLGAAALMLQEFRKDGAPEGKLGQGVSIYFQCKDALTIYRDITLRGIQSGKPFVGNAMWVTTLLDPDGYKIHFVSPISVPEGTEFAEPAG